MLSSPRNIEQLLHGLCTWLRIDWICDGKQHERMRTDDRCSGVCFVSRWSQSCASQVLSVSRCKKEVCNMHGHAPRKGTGAYGHFCPSPLQDVPSVYSTPCGHRQRDWALPQARARSSYHAQRNLSPPLGLRWLRHSVRTHNTGKHCEFAEIIAKDCLLCFFKKVVGSCPDALRSS